MFKKLAHFPKIFLFASLGTLMFCFNSPKDDDEKMKTILVSVKNALSFIHYQPKPINNTFSKEVFKTYLEKIDPAKRYFLASDIAEFKKHELLLDNYFEQGNLVFYKLTINRFFKRMEEIDSITQDIFKKTIDLNVDEEFILEPKIKTYAKDKNELTNEWRKFIKLNILQEMETLKIKEEKQKEKKDSVIKYQLKDTIKYKPTTEQQKLVKATTEVKDLLKDSFRRLKKRKTMDWFTVYVNSYTEVFDPHSNYFSPEDKDAFDSSFKGKIIGIGALIQEKKGNIFLGPLVVGAPAWKSKQLSEGDKLLKVKSKEKGENVNIVGMLADEVVKLIRGENNTKVMLTVQKKDGSIKEVNMMREEVEIEDTFAKGTILKNEKNELYGYIQLPSFNIDFEDKKGRNASDDIKAELLKLKKQDIKGVILDLRNNGGGSLTEVADIMGLFMKKGPSVQVKANNGKKETLQNKENNPIWEGPLLIMQNELSASASEILAGAVQDYGRGIVMGSTASYGKGTVQTFIPLNRFLNTSEDYGSIKLTIQKFYRVTGHSTQLKGVESDIVMNGVYEYAELGEKHNDYALEWDQIEPIYFNKEQRNNTKELVSKSKARLAENKNYALLQESIKWRGRLDKEEKMSLQKSKYDKDMESRKLMIKKYKPLSKLTTDLNIINTTEDETRIKSDTVFARKNKMWVKNLKRDLFLQESVQILREMK